MKRVNVVSYCDWRSYGSILQALGLQKALAECGFDGYILRPEPEPPARLSFRGTRGIGLRQKLVNAHKRLNYAALNRRYKNSNRFIKENIPILYCGDYHSIANNPPQGDVYIAGSDQVWQPSRMDPFLFLSFVPDSVRKISYAASMGISVIPKEKAELFAEHMKRFESISVRESDNKAAIEALTSRMVHRHIDPVFLMSGEEWKEYERPYPGIKRPYILVYAIYWDSALNSSLQELGKNSGLDIVLVASSFRRIYADKRVYDADPAQFLWLLDHAEMVVTSSFHGVAMSILFDKPFSAVIDPGAPSRITDLLNTLGVHNREIRELSQSGEDNRAFVLKRIQEERNSGLEYLVDSLNRE